MRQEMFRRADRDGHGKITKDELIEAAPKGGDRAKGLNVDDLFNQIDVNGDGGIDESENGAFLDRMGARHRPSAADFAQKLFEKADADQDGKLTRSELMSALPKQSSSSALDELFKDADEDGDGVISQAELESTLSKHMAEANGTYTRTGENADADRRGPSFTRVA